MPGRESNQILVQLEGVVIGYSQDTPLAEISSLNVRCGEIIAIAGLSGIGKTTLIKTIAGLVQPLAGRISVCGAEIPKRPDRGNLGYIPQRLGLVRHASVFHNVLIGSRATYGGFLGVIASKDAKEMARKSIEKMGLTEKIWEPVRRLSGGQQRRVATARTLAQSPRVILADEFLSELDHETMSNVSETVVNYARSADAAVILIEHDMKRASNIADKIMVMDEGTLKILNPESMMMEVQK